MWRATSLDELRVAVEIGEALREVDRAEIGGEARHHREDGGADAGQAGSQLNHEAALEDAVLPVLPDLVPGEVLAVHRDVDAGRQHLRERQRAPQVEQAVGAAERIGHHRAGQDDGPVVEAGVGQRPRGVDHRVRAVRDDDGPFGALRGSAPRSRRRPSSSMSRLSIIITVSTETSSRDRPSRSISGDVGVAEEQASGQLVVLLVERAAGHEDCDWLTHGVVGSGAARAGPTELQ